MMNRIRWEKRQSVTNRCDVAHEDRGKIGELKLFLNLATDGTKRFQGNHWAGGLHNMVPRVLGRYFMTHPVGQWLDGVVLEVDCLVKYERVQRSRPS
ncbi:hypothetical protein HAX54_011418 [Datura stramonium]|uniref:Uncharacterized protein n=1 Tax=Datura stramonium TaxID=4076 RepID=A0ABS8Y241_DATST|nr:hypothetical protein [Datura stramonium]